MPKIMHRAGEQFLNQRLTMLYFLDRSRERRYNIIYISSFIHLYIQHIYSYSKWMIDKKSPIAWLDSRFGDILIMGYHHEPRPCEIGGQFLDSLSHIILPPFVLEVHSEGVRSQYGLNMGTTNTIDQCSNRNANYTHNKAYTIVWVDKKSERLLP